MSGLMFRIGANANEYRIVWLSARDVSLLYKLFLTKTDWIAHQGDRLLSRKATPSTSSPWGDGDFALLSERHHEPHILTVTESSESDSLLLEDATTPCSSTDGSTSSVEPDSLQTVLQESHAFVPFVARGIGDSFLLPLPAWPIFAALRSHGLMQGLLPENCPDVSTSPLQPLSLPEPLRPTPLQLVMSHRRAIDRFPFPRLRDNMIVLQDVIDVDEFIRDLFCMPGLSFRFDLRRQTWNSTSWKIEPEFAAKWGYLFH